MTNRDGMLIWITGLAGSGKTTLGREVEQGLLRLGQRPIFLDGDALREVTAGVFGFTPEERKKCAEFYSRLCALLTSQGFTVICCTISMFDDVRQVNRTLNQNYLEVYLKASEGLLAQRNKKGLYSGQADLVVGRGIIYEEPRKPDVLIDLDVELGSPKQLAEKVLQQLKDRFWRRGHEVQHQS